MSKHGTKHGTGEGEGRLEETVQVMWIPASMTAFRFCPFPTVRQNSVLQWQTTEVLFLDQEKLY